MRSSVDGSLDYRLVVRIAHLGTQPKVQINRVYQPSQFLQKYLDLLELQLVYESMFRPPQYLLVFQEQRRSRNGNKPLLRDQLKQGISAAQAGPQTGNHHRSVQYN